MLNRGLMFIAGCVLVAACGQGYLTQRVWQEQGRQIYSCLETLVYRGQNELHSPSMLSGALACKRISLSPASAPGCPARLSPTCVARRA